MNKSISKSLIEEHQIIRKGLLHLAYIKDELLCKNVIPRSTFYLLISFFHNYAFKFHTKKEDEILFSKISKIKDKKDLYIIDELIDEHSQCKVLFKNIVKSLTPYYQNPWENYADLHDAIDVFINKFSAHIWREERYGLPICEREVNLHNIQGVEQAFMLFNSAHRPVHHI